MSFSKKTFIALTALWAFSFAIAQDAATPVEEVTQAPPSGPVEEMFTEIILDASGSMLGEVKGESKIQTAKLMLANFMKSEGKGHKIAVRTFGSRDGKCNDVSLKMDFYDKDPNRLFAVIGEISPKNKARTPLATAMEQAYKHLKGVKGKRNLIVFTDGKETCDKDPCAIAKKLHKEINVKIYLIAYGVKNVKDFREMKCIVDEQGPNPGLAIQSDSPESLAAAFAEVRKKIQPNTQGIIVKGPDPTAMATAKAVNGKDEFNFLASMGTDLPAGRYNVTVHFAKPFIFQNVDVKPRQLKVLQITGNAQISLPFNHPDMQTEVIHSESLARYTIQMGEALSVPPGTYSVVTRSRGGLAYQWPKQLITPNDNIKLQPPPFGILHYKTTEAQPIRFYKKGGGGSSVDTKGPDGSLPLKKVLTEREPDAMGLSNEDILLEEGVYNLVFSNGAIEENVKVLRGKSTTLP